MSWVIAAVGGYLIGTISFTRIAGRIAVPGADLSTTEYAVEGTDEKWIYRGVSATSVLNRAGWQWGLVVIVLDALKAFLPVMAVRMAGGGSGLEALIALAVVVGHVWPVWWRFDGGRGQSCLLGILLAIEPVALPVALLGGAVVGLLVFTSSYLARNSGPAVLIPWFAWTSEFGPYFWFAVGANIVYWLALRGDLAEERRARRARGIPSMPFGARIAIAWNDFTHED